jgi:biopolymer transport protein ExbD
MTQLRSVNRFSTFSGRINLVPMIDIVFQLLVFFMVASHLVNSEREPIQLPQPVHSLAREKQLNNRLMINLFSDSTGRISKIKANADLVRDLPSLVDLVLRYGPKLQANNGTVIIRANKNMQFAEIERVLQAVANAGVTSVHVAAEQDEKAARKTP